MTNLGTISLFADSLAFWVMAKEIYLSLPSVDSPVANQRVVDAEENDNLAPLLIAGQHERWDDFLRSVRDTLRGNSECDSQYFSNLCINTAVARLGVTHEDADFLGGALMGMLLFLSREKE